MCPVWSAVVSRPVHVIDEEVLANKGLASVGMAPQDTKAGAGYAG
jgi:hypothetical protein